MAAVAVLQVATLACLNEDPISYHLDYGGQAAKEENLHRSISPNTSTSSLAIRGVFKKQLQSCRTDDVGESGLSERRKSWACNLQEPRQ